jgi:hypothetical protein
MPGHEMTFPPARTAPAAPRDPWADDACSPATTGVTVPSFGWTGVAIALHRLRQQPTPSVVVVRQLGHAPLVVDVEAHAFWWDSPLSAFPAEPVDIEVTVEPRDAADTSRPPGTDLDALLWLVGTNSFPGELAWWLQRDDRYELVRWPDPAVVALTPAQARMTAMLDCSSRPVGELADAGAADPAEARRLVNALSLMDLLRAESPGRGGAAAGAEPGRDAPAPRSLLGGLVGRARDLLGL